MSSGGLTGSEIRKGSSVATNECRAGLTGLVSWLGAIGWSSLNFRTWPRCEIVPSC